MSIESTLERLDISQPAIDRVDGELGFYDEFRRDELDYLDQNNTPLKLVIITFFEEAIKMGDTSGHQVMAGSLFASRVLRYSAEEQGCELPRLSLIEHGTQFKKLTKKLDPAPDKGIDFEAFESDYARQRALTERLRTFRNPMSRLAATAVCMLHEDILR